MARYFGIDPLWVRVAFVAASAAGGFGIVVYLLGWAFMPVDASVTPVRRPWTGRRASLQVGAGAGLLLLALLLAVRAASAARATHLPKMNASDRCHGTDGPPRNPRKMNTEQ